MLFRNATADARWIALGVPQPFLVDPDEEVNIAEPCASAYERSPHWQPADQADEAGKAED